MTPRPASCPQCRVAPVPDVHLCLATRWRVWPGDDGLVECPMCGERLAPGVVLEHLGLRTGMRSLDDADHEVLDQAAAGTVSDRAWDAIAGGAW